MYYDSTIHKLNHKIYSFVGVKEDLMKEFKTVDEDGKTLYCVTMKVCNH